MEPGVLRALLNTRKLRKLGDGFPRRLSELKVMPNRFFDQVGFQVQALTPCSMAPLLPSVWPLHLFAIESFADIFQSGSPRALKPLAVHDVSYSYRRFGVGRWAAPPAFRRAQTRRLRLRCPCIGLHRLG